MKQNTKLIVYRTDDGDFLCPSCKDTEVALVMDNGNSDTYHCVWCRITGDIDRLEIVNIGHETPKYYNLKSLQHRLDEAFRNDKSHTERLSY